MAAILLGLLNSQSESSLHGNKLSALKTKWPPLQLSLVFQVKVLPCLVSFIALYEEFFSVFPLLLSQVLYPDHLIVFCDKFPG